MARGVSTPGLTRAPGVTASQIVTHAVLNRWLCKPVPGVAGLSTAIVGLASTQTQLPTVCWLLSLRKSGRLRYKPSVFLWD